MLYSTKDIQKELRVGRDTAYSLMHSKSFPSFRIGKRYFVTPEDLQKWLSKQPGRTVKL